jgi:inosine-uridine nucleoside N-ribohydrolase
MGGAIYASGNTNIRRVQHLADAEAARVVFERWPKVRVLSWETTMLYPFNGEQVAHFFNMGTAKSRFFHDIYQKTLGFLREKFHQDLLFSADGLAVACAIDPSIITRKEEHFMEVEAARRKYARPDRGGLVRPGRQTRQRRDHPGAGSRALRADDRGRAALSMSKIDSKELLRKAQAYAPQAEKFLGDMLGIPSVNKR